MSGSRFFAVVLCFCILNLSPVAFAEIQEEVSVGILEIWAKVTDKNNKVVSDLTPDEFRIYIDGKEADVRCFDKVFEDPFDFAAMDEEKSEQPKRRFVFYFDMLNTPVRSMDYLKSHMAQFVQNSFRDGDEAMVFVLTPTVNLGIVLKMTDNKESLIDTIRKMRGNPTLEVRVRNNEKQLLDVLGTNVSQASLSGSGAFEAAPQLRAMEAVRQARMFAKSLSLEEENLSKLTMDSFLSIAQYIDRSNYDGRLVMIYASGGFSLRPGMNYFEIIERALEQVTLAGSEDLVFREQPDRDFEREVTKVLGVLNRLNVTIYTIDARGLSTIDRGVDRNVAQLTQGFDSLAYKRELQDSLSVIAGETGGLAIINNQNFQKGLAEITSDMSQQYWLCTNLPSPKKRGGYHSIDIKVSRPGLNVRHRKGYID